MAPPPRPYRLRQGAEDARQGVVAYGGHPVHGAEAVGGAKPRPHAVWRCAAGALDDGAWPHGAHEAVEEERLVVLQRPQAGRVVAQQVAPRSGGRQWPVKGPGQVVVWREGLKHHVPRAPEV